MTKVHVRTIFTNVNAFFYRFWTKFLVFKVSKIFKKHQKVLEIYIFIYIMKLQQFVAIVFI